MVRTTFRRFLAKAGSVFSRDRVGAVIAFVVSCALVTTAFFSRGILFAEASATVSWTADGVNHSSTSVTGFNSHSETCGSPSANTGCVAATTAGDYIYAWIENDGVSTWLAAQKINSAGAFQWGADGVRIYESATETLFTEVSVVPDTVGGAIVTFRTTGASFYDVYAQRVSPSGAYQWGHDGKVVVANGAASSFGPVAVADGSDGVIVAFMQGNFSTNADIRAQRLNAAGAQQWGANGTAISTAANEQVYPVIVSDGAGGATIGWEDHRNGDANTDIYAQRVNSAGVVQWAANGVVVSSAAGNQDRMRSSAGDGSGGAVFTWEDGRSAGGSPGAYVQYMNSAGVAQWTANGVAVETTTWFQSTPKLAMVGTDTYVAYSKDNGSGVLDLYVQKLNNTGTSQFAGEGLALTSTATAHEYAATVTASGDGSGDALITFVREGTSFDPHEILGQRINSSGTAQWTSGGILAVEDDDATTSHPVIDPFATTNASGDIIIVRQRVTGSHTNLIGQRLQNSNGAPQWSGTVAAIFPGGPTGTAEQVTPLVAADGSGNYFTAWQDHRASDTSSDVYVQKLNASGVAQWTSGGVAVATGMGNNQPVSGIVSDGAGGVLLAWVDGVTFDMKVQRLTSTGALSGGWSAGGVSASATTFPTFNSIASNGANGLYVAYLSNGDAVLNRVNGAGTVPWGASGVTLNAAQVIPGNDSIAIVPDGSGGAYAVWRNQDSNDGIYSLHATRIDSTGAVVTGWTAGGTVVTSEVSIANPALAVTSDGYLVVTWDEDPTSLDRNVKAQKYSPAGVAQWTAGGVSVVTDGAQQQGAHVVASDTGAIVVWADARSGTDDIYAQRLDASGAAQWTANGIVVTNAANAQSASVVDTDNAAGVIVSWYDERAGSGTEFDVYAQRIDSTGAAKWTANGLAIATRAGINEREPKIVSNGNAGAVVAFSVLTSPQEARAQFVADSDGAPSVTVTAPNGGESLTGNASTNITWSNAGVVDHYKITLSTDGGSTFPTTIVASTASSPYAWTISNITTASARLKIEALDANGVLLTSDTSNANFTITAAASGGGGGGGGNPQPSIELGLPNGGEQIHASSVYNVFWTVQGIQVQNVRLAYSIDSGATYTTITSTANTGTGFYAWTTPDVTAPSVLLRAQALGGGGSILAADISNASFSIFGGSSTTTPAVNPVPPAGNTDASTSTSPVDSSTSTPVVPAEPPKPALLNAAVHVGVNVTTMEFPDAQPVAKSGSVLTYRVDVTNAGGAEARNVLLTDVIPPGTSYEVASLSLDGVALTDQDDADAARFELPTRTATFALGTIPAAGHRYVGMRVRVLSGAKTLHNQVVISADGLTTLMLEQNMDVGVMVVPKPVVLPPVQPEPPIAAPISVPAPPAAPATPVTPVAPPISVPPVTPPPIAPEPGSTPESALPSESDTGAIVPPNMEAFVPETQDALAPIDWIARPASRVIETPVLDAFVTATKSIPVLGTLTENVREGIKATRANETVQITNAVALTPAATGLAAVTTTSAVGFGGLARYAMFLLTQPISLLDRRKRKGYGTIYNVGTKVPVDLATVRLLDATGQKAIATRVTDRFGRYMFLPPPGTYMIEVRKPGFDFPPLRALTGISDGPFSDLHVGGTITTTEGIIAKNIPLEPAGDLRGNNLVISSASRFRFQWAIASIGPGFAIASYAVSPRWEQVIAILFQLAFTFLFVRLAAPKRPKSWGTIRDTNGQPVKQAVVRIVESAYNKVLEAQVTDARGRYAFLAGQNRYFLTAERAGYAQARTDVIDFTAAKEPAFIANDIELKPAP